MLSLRYPSNYVLSKWSSLFEAVMESRIKMSTLQRRSEIWCQIAFSFSYWMKCCTGQHRKGCTIHILTFKGIEGGYIYRTALKLFKWTYSWFDIVARMLKILGIQNIQRKTQPYTWGVQGLDNRTLYTLFLINWTINALFSCSTLNLLCSA